MIQQSSRHQLIAVAVCLAATAALASNSALATVLSLGQPNLNGSPVNQTVLGTGPGVAGTGITNGVTAGYSGGFTGSSNPAYAGSVGVSAVFNGPQGSSGGLVGGTNLLPFLTGTGLNAGNASWQITYDFSGLTGGVLPAGGSFYLRDFDGGSIISNMTARDASGGLLSTAFFGDPINFDLNGPTDSPGQPNPGPGDYATVSFNSGVYSVQAPSGGFDNPVLEMLVSQPIKSLTLTWFSPPGINNDIIFSDTQVSSVPVPGALALLGIGALAMLGSARRRR